MKNKIHNNQILGQVSHMCKASTLLQKCLLEYWFLWPYNEYLVHKGDKLRFLSLSRQDFIIPNSFQDIQNQSSKPFKWKNLAQELLPMKALSVTKNS